MKSLAAIVLAIAMAILGGVLVLLAIASFTRPAVAEVTPTLIVPSPTPSILVPTVTSAPTVTATTEWVPTPTVSIQGFADGSPYTVQEGGVVDLARQERIDFWTEYCPTSQFLPCASYFTPIVYNGGAMKEYLPSDQMNGLVYRLKDGLYFPMRGIYVIWLHSGSYMGRSHPANWLRFAFECGWAMPCTDQRRENMVGYLGQTIVFDQGQGEVNFKVDSIVFVNEGEWLQCESTESSACIAAMNANFDRFYDEPVVEGEVQIFLVFCGGEGDPTDFFSSRYVVRLRLDTTQ